VSRKALFAAAMLAGLPATSLAQVDLSRPPDGAVEEQAPAAPGAAPRDKVIVMFDNFFISLVAASKCADPKPDDATMTAFTRNMVIVQRIATSHYKNQLPDKSIEEITALLDARAERLDTIINDAIQAKGCTDPQIARMVESFDANAKVQFRLNEPSKQ